MKFFSFVFVLWIPNIACFLRWSSNDNVEYKEEIPVEISQGQRTRRSTDDSFHPQTYDLDLKVEGSQVHFHLERNDDINTNVPTLSLSQGILTDIYLQEQKDSIFYQDIKNGASFVVQQDKMNPESMFGTFNSGGDSFILQSPKERLSLLHSGSNRFELIKEIRNRTDFGDGLKSGDNLESPPVRKHHRQKRATGSNQIELLIVCDYAIYDYWYSQSEASTPSEKETDALTSVRQYYAFVLNGMDVMYKNIQTSDYTISVLFAGIVISQTPNDAPWTESIKNTTSSPNIVDSEECLNRFTAWINANSSHLPERDHSMLFTRYDLSYRGSTSNAGLAWTGVICGTYSQSIVQDGFNFIIITVAAHELGHSLSAQHDGTTNLCSSNDAYIMASSSSPQQDSNKARNPWKFSSCSTVYFTSQIDTLESSGESSNCMKTLGSNFDPTALAPYDQSLAGQVYDADAQCVQIYGNSSYMCRYPYNGNYESICSVLWCYNPEITQCSWAVAGEGTTCGNNKWCVSGLCTSDSIAPSGNENCLYGDQRGKIFSNVNWTCADMYTIAPHNCDIVPVKCCATCNPESTTVATSKETQTTTTTSKSPTTSDYLTTTESVTTTQPLTTTKSLTTIEPLTTTESVTTSELITTTESVTTTEPVTTTESFTTTEPLTTIESVTTTEPLTTTESVTTTEPVTITESVTSTEPLTTTESVTTTAPLTTTESFITTEPVTITESDTSTEPLSTTESVTTTAPLTTTEKVTSLEPVTITESVTSTEPLTTTESVTTTEPVTITESVTSTEPLTTTESVTTTEPLATTESVTTTEPVTITESVTSTEPLTTTEPVTTTEPLATTESVTTTEPLTTTESVTTTEPLTTTESVTKTEPLTTTESVTREPVTTIESVTTTEPLTTTESVTTTKPQTPTESVTTTKQKTSTESVTTEEPLTATDAVTSVEDLTTTESATTTKPHTMNESVVSTKPLSTSESDTTTKSPTSTESDSTEKSLTTTKPVSTTGPITTTESFTTIEPLTISESVTTLHQLTTTEPLITKSVTTTETVTTIESIFTTKPLTTTDSVTSAQPLTTIKSATTTEHQTTIESVTTTEPLTSALETSAELQTTTLEPLSSSISALVDTSKQFEASVSIDKTWNPAYANSSSTEYLDLQKNFTKQLINMYENTTIKDDLQNVTITGFRNGSVIADYIIELKPGTTESETTITNITKQAVDNIKSNPSPEFDLIQLVDTDKIVVEEVIAKTTDTMTSPADGTTQTTTQPGETTDNLEPIIIGISAVAGVIILGIGICIIFCCIRSKKSFKNADKTNKSNRSQYDGHTNHGMITDNGREYHSFKGSQGTSSYRQPVDPWRISYGESNNTHPAWYPGYNARDTMFSSGGHHNEGFYS
ncbi:unnamed protein product [Mytilus edulis]|uniref:Peptidase M12B domain-containing protein n=1 Tax=Mytilus edulis TaxID=6550 RepID=A0A8S3UJP8_MYTED|nr:unnamed protein product [Mytilus edulis]